ncbi:hypothetical protein AB0I28_13300 [Phytomonospora sp. NPDC050363]|uniref:hypothetical protein n=1 Tax=Phytomonospora sp. NPDC050363 TaxID=3155642 RepID=UPI0033CC11BA
MFVLLLLGRIEPRRRVLAGASFTVAGLAWTVVALAVAPGFAVHGLVTAVTGAVLWISGVIGRRRARPDGEVTPAGHGDGR